jgi:hypothetical protein
MPATRVLVFGTMRSGTTLMCDLLSKPGHSLVLNEPMLGTPWRGTDFREKKLTSVVKRFGFDDNALVGIGDKAVPTIDWFRQRLRPELDKLALWGIKEVILEQAEFLLEEVQPQKLILCARDLRDVYLSALDLITKGLLIFDGGGPLRDEAWAVERIRTDVATMGTLAKRDHLRVRYETFVNSPDEQAALMKDLGLPSFGGGGTTYRDSGAIRSWEADKHKGEITGQSVSRHSNERDGFAHTVATGKVWQFHHETSSRPARYKRLELERIARRSCLFQTTYAEDVGKQH